MLPLTWLIKLYYIKFILKHCMKVLIVWKILNNFQYNILCRSTFSCYTHYTNCYQMLVLSTSCVMVHYLGHLCLMVSCPGMMMLMSWSTLMTLKRSTRYSSRLCLYVLSNVCRIALMHLRLMFYSALDTDYIHWLCLYL